MLSFVYICIVIGDPEGRIVIPLTGLTQTHCMPSQVRIWFYNVINRDLFVSSEFS